MLVCTLLHTTLRVGERGFSIGGKNKKDAIKWGQIKILL